MPNAYDLINSLMLVNLGDIIRHSLPLVGLQIKRLRRLTIIKAMRGYDAIAFL